MRNKKNVKRKPLNLVKFNHRCVTRLIEQWQNKNVEISFSAPHSSTWLVKITADGDWSGIIDLYEWFCYLSPKLAQLALSAHHIEKLQLLFDQTETPLTLPAIMASVLPYKRVQIVQQIDKQKKNSILNSLFCVQAAECKLWVTQTPKTIETNYLAPIDAPNVALSSIPILFSLEIGRSLLTMKTLAKASLGDILLIQKVTQYIIIEGEVVSYYEQNEQGVIMLDNTESHLLENNEISGQVSNKLMPLTEIPITLTFVLQQTKVPLSQLTTYSQGAVIPLLPEAEKKIIIKANGQIIGAGELLQLDENHLGVEINQLYPEQQEVQTAEDFDHGE